MTETVFGRFAGTATRRKDAPFLHVLEETAAIYDIPAGDISYCEMENRVAAWADRFAAAAPLHRHTSFRIGRPARQHWQRGPRLAPWAGQYRRP